MTMKTITVNLKERSYPILVGESIANLGKHLKNKGFSKNVFVVTNPTVKKHCFAKLASGLEKAGFNVKLSIVPDGEKFKTLDSIKKIYSDAAKAGVDRKTVAVALGGGVVGDMCGFFAATYLRGIPLVQVPTTLLAMVDSSIGGKTGVDLKEGKNLVGAFYQPRLVLIDVSALQTLPKGHLLNGMAEVIKYSIVKDEEFFNFLNGNSEKLFSFQDGMFEKMILRCSAIKADVVSKDERETKGVREILNFGHTFGHAIETLSDYKLCHGQAVAAGMVLAGNLGVRLGMFNRKDNSLVYSLLAKAGFPVDFHLKKFKIEKILSVLRRDKKVVDGKFRFVVPKKIGEAVVVKDVSLSLIKEVIGK
jgi:3-dehydroquinate synthase